MNIYQTDSPQVLTNLYVLKKKKEPVDKVGKLCLNEGEKEATEKKGERLY